MVNLFSKPIVLLGFMGSGKSTLGKQLAASMNRIFIDLDRFIETEERRSITEIFEKDGEPFFRRIESKALANVLNYPKQVISVGGGAPCQPGNMSLIREKSRSVYLKVSVAELILRLNESSTIRPLLKGKSADETEFFINELMAKREAFYLQADIVIESDEITTEMILSKLVMGMDSEAGGAIR